MDMTRTFFERRLKTVFQVTPTLGAPPIGLTLHSIQRTAATRPPPVPQRLVKASSTAFTLLFHGPLDPVLEQCIYSLRPTDAPRNLPEALCFLVPMGPGMLPATMQYGAMFDSRSSQVSYPSPRTATALPDLIGRSTNFHQDP